MPDPYQQDEPISLAGMGLDAIGWATYRNPYFTTRMGTSGWDPRGRKWMSKLNAILAPGSNKAYGAFDDMAKYGDWRDSSNSAKRRDRVLRDNLSKARYRKRMHAPIEARMESDMGDFHRQHLSERPTGHGARRKKGVRKAQQRYTRHQRQYGKMYEKLEEFRSRGPDADIKEYEAEIRRLGRDRQVANKEMARLRKSAKILGMDPDDAVAVARAPARAGGPFSKIIGITGERPMNARERHITGMAKKKLGGMKWLGNLFGKESTWGARHAAAAYGAGRILTGVSLATLAHDVTKLALTPLQAFAEVGVTARAAPVLQTGAGLREPGVAATIRQQAIQRMQSSAYAPRNLIGQEAGFLHV